MEIGGMPAIRRGGRWGIHYDYSNFILEDIIFIPNKNYIYQYLNPGPDDDRVITLNTTNAKAGDRFVIKHIGHGTYTTCFEIKQGATTLDKIYAQVIKGFIFDGAEWRGLTLGTRSRDEYAGIGIGDDAFPGECGVAIGMDAEGHLDGVGIGKTAKGHIYGVGIGYNAEGYASGIAIGESALGHDYGVALGRRCDTDSKYYSIAIGYRSKNTRYAELAINMGDEVTDDIPKQYQQIVIGSWTRKTTNATPITMRCGGQGGAAAYFVIRPQSALTFKIIVTARENTSGDCAAYLFDGLIKRDGANNTTLCVCNKTVLHEDDDTWDCDVAADDANEALEITITGDASYLVRWAARLDGVETSFVVA